MGHHDGGPSITNVEGPPLEWENLMSDNIESRD